MNCFFASAVLCVYVFTSMRPLLYLHSVPMLLPPVCLATQISCPTPPGMLSAARSLAAPSLPKAPCCALCGRPSLSCLRPLLPTLAPLPASSAAGPRSPACALCGWPSLSCLRTLLPTPRPPACALCSRPPLSCLRLLLSSAPPPPRPAQPFCLCSPSIMISQDSRHLSINVCKGMRAVDGVIGV